MPGEPLLKSHHESVDVFIQLLNKSNGLDNWFILPVYISGTLHSRVRMTKTKLGSIHVLVLNLLHHFHEVGSEASLKLRDGLIERSGNSGLLEDPIEK
jgi:hypothetical protein